METRRIGRTDVEVTSIALGTWGLAEGAYGAVDDGRLREVARAALEAGVTAFDLAPLWGDGEAERVVGEVLAEDGRDDAVVITRGGVFREDGVVRGDFSEEGLVEQCEASLERLGRDRVELWLLHDPGDDVLRQEEWRRAVERLEDAGKIAAWGASVGDGDEARLAIEAGAAAVCLPYSILTRDSVDDLATELATRDCGLIARSVLSYGLLAGQWSPMKTFDDDDHRSRRWSLDALEARVRQVEDLRFLARGRHRDLATAAIRFALHQPLLSTAAIGARTAKQIRHAADAAGSGGPYMDDDDLARVAKIIG